MSTFPQPIALSATQILKLKFEQNKWYLHIVARKLRNIVKNLELRLLNVHSSLEQKVFDLTKHKKSS